MLKVLYSFFLGLLIVAFVGLGVASFYPKPVSPDYPITVDVTDEAHASQQEQAQRNYEAASMTYSDRLEDYDRNVAVIMLAAAVALIVLGLTLHAKISVIADGLLAGGLFALLYSIARGAASGEPIYGFMVTAAGLIAAMLVGYVKFVKPKPAKKRAK